MSDLQRGSPDDQFIYVDDGDELRHWSTLLQITPDKLKAAVSAVGTSAAKVRTHLKLEPQESYKDSCNVRRIVAQRQKIS